MFLMWPGVKIAAVFSLGWSQPSPSLLGSLQQMAFKSKKKWPLHLSLICNLIRRQAKLQSTVIQNRMAVTFFEETRVLGIARTCLVLCPRGLV